MFTSEIENEKKYSQRIFSKAKVLQMYSQSPAEDIVYLGDSFDNQDYMDFAKMSKTENPLVSNRNDDNTVEFKRKMDTF